MCIFELWRVLMRHRLVRSEPYKTTTSLTVSPFVYINHVKSLRLLGTRIQPAVPVNKDLAELFETLTSFKMDGDPWMLFLYIQYSFYKNCSS